MDSAAGGVEPGGSGLTRSPRLAEEGVEEGQELEGTHEKGAAAGRMVRVAHRDEQPPVYLVHLDNLAGPDVGRPLRLPVSR